jgi:DNA-binding GntR family transcriptional regulator
MKIEKSVFLNQDVFDSSGQGEQSPSKPQQGARMASRRTKRTNGQRGVTMTRDGALAKPKAPKSEEAYNVLKAAVLTGEIPPGKILQETALTEKFGLSRTPFREACNRLQNEQLLEVLPRHGYYIPELSLRIVRDLLECRLLLETAIVEAAALRARPDEIEKLEILEKSICTLPAVSSDDFINLVKANTQFHLSIARMTQNLEIVTLAARVLEQANRILFMEIKDRRFSAKDFSKYHQPIVRAIASGDGTAARHAMADDIEYTQKYVLGSDMFGAGRSVNVNVEPVSSHKALQGELQVELQQNRE